MKYARGYSKETGTTEQSQKVELHGSPEIEENSRLVPVMEPAGGLEPPTCALRVRCSTD